MPETGIIIHPLHHNTVIAFNNSGVVLKNRPYSDLIDLAIMAHQSKNPNLLYLFEKLPDLESLKSLKLKEFEKQVLNNK